MTSTVTHFNFGFSNSALRMPYAIAVLSCGHSAACEIKPTRYACGGCGKDRSTTTQCECGYFGCKIIEVADPHKAHFRITQVGDILPCGQCEAEAKQTEWLKALDPSLVHHTRVRFGGLHLYRRDPQSPSGFMLMGSVAPTSANEALLASKRVCQLSPTEQA